MSTSRLATFAAVTTAAALAVGGAASAAEAPVVGDQATLSVKRAPVTFPGTGVERGERLPAGARIVFRDVTLEGDQQPAFRLRAARGRTLQGLGMREGEDVGIAVVSPERYTGRRQVRVRAYAAPQAEGEVAARVYALTR